MDNLGQTDAQYKPPQEMSQPGQYPPPEYPPQAPGYPPQQMPGYPSQPGLGYQPQAPQPMFPASHTTNTNTTVVIQQPQTQILVQGPGDWSSDICACCDDMTLCLIGLCCPFFLPCVVSVKAGECCCVGWMCPVALRATIRERYNIRGSIFSDFCTLNHAYLCAFCQMGRELDYRNGK